MASGKPIGRANIKNVKKKAPNYDFSVWKISYFGKSHQTKLIRIFNLLGDVFK